MKKIIISCALLLTACANNQVIDSQIESAAKKQAAQSTITPEQAIKNARTQLAKASKAELSFYTPLHYKDAQRALEKVEDLQKEHDIKNQSQHKLLIITEAFKAEKIINKAFTVKETIIATLADALEYKKTLEVLGSNKEFPSGYNNAVDDLIDLFKLIEKNNVEQARKEQTSLLANMTKLEIKTLIKQHVVPAINILDKAKDNDADDFAELTYEQAETTINRAKKYISSNYRDRKYVESIGKNAVTAARRALTIGSVSQSMVKLNEEDAEQKALEIETLLGKIATGLAVNDIAGLSFREQAIKMAEYAEIQKQQIKVLKAKVTHLNEEKIEPVPQMPTVETDTPTVETDTPTAETETPTLETDTPKAETDTPTLETDTPTTETETLEIKIN